MRVNMLAKAAVLLGVYAATLALASEGSSVPHLTAAEFPEKMADGKVYFVKAYAPWCGHCKRLAPAWAELATSFKDSNRIGIVSVDCTQQQDLCSKEGVKGYPTLKVYYNGESKDVYKGPRELAKLKEYIEEQANNFLDETTA